MKDGLRYPGTVWLTDVGKVRLRYPCSVELADRWKSRHRYHGTFELADLWKITLIYPGTSLLKFLKSWPYINILVPLGRLILTSEA